MNKLGWIAAGGLGVGFVSLALVAAVSANDLKDFNLGGLTLDRLLRLSDSCRDTVDAGVDPTATERSWNWDGGDEIEIAVPAKVHYRGGEGDKVIARGSPEVLAHLHVHDGAIGYSCNGHSSMRDLDITLPGHPFKTIGLAGSGELDLQNITQPYLDLRSERSHRRWAAHATRLMPRPRPAAVDRLIDRRSIDRHV